MSQIPSAMAGFLTKMGMVSGGAALAGSLAAGPARALSDDVLAPIFGWKTQQDRLREQAWNAPSPQQQALRAQRLREAMQYNEATLASRYPGLYAKILAGRDLPMGAVVYGGTPDRQAMDNITYGMASGQMGRLLVQ